MNAEASTGPRVRVQRPSLAEPEDYFSPKSSPRPSLNHAHTDTYAALMGAMRRGSPFGTSKEPLELPRFSPSLPDAPADVAARMARRRSSVLDAWATLPRRQQILATQCAVIGFAAAGGLAVGFVLGLWVALNHLDLHPVGPRP